MEITSGKIKSAQKVVIYGPEGVGKTTFASKFPDPVFIDTEGGTKHYDVKRFQAPSSWEMLIEEVRHVIKNPSCCKSLVIDTADWAEKLCAENVLAKYGKSSIEEFGYGKGYTYLYEEFGKLLNLLEDVVEKGVNVVICAHAQMRKFEQPHEFGAYDRWELKLSKQIASMVKEWADMVLFANYETLIFKDSNGHAKAQGNKRVMFTTHHSCWDAKNREGLPEKLDFDYKEIEHIFADTVSNTSGNTKAETDDVPFTFEEKPEEETRKSEADEPEHMKKLKDLMGINKVSEYEIMRVVAERGYFPEDMKISEYPKEFTEGVLTGAWEQVFKQIEALRDTAF